MLEDGLKSRPTMTGVKHHRARLSNQIDDRIQTSFNDLASRVNLLRSQYVHQTNWLKLTLHPLAKRVNHDTPCADQRHIIVFAQEPYLLLQELAMPEVVLRKRFYVSS